MNFGLSNLLIGADGAITSGIDNVSLGQGALGSVTSGNYNTAIGFDALTASTGDNSNTAIGFGSLTTLNGGTENTAVGYGSLGFLRTGNFNVALGWNAGSSYNGSESNNITIGENVVGLLGENNAIRIGNSSATTCFVQGIAGVPISSNINVVTINTATGQLGSENPGTTLLSTLTGNDNVPVSPIAGNINIKTANATVEFLGTPGQETLNFGINNLVLGSTLPSLAGGDNNTGLGASVSPAITSGTDNTAIGQNALHLLNSGSFNTAVGSEALTGITTGVFNVAVGAYALGNAITTADNNTALGYSALNNTTTGSGNIAIGWLSGQLYTSTESWNIILGSSDGTPGESGIMRLGNDTTNVSASPTTQTYMQGVYGNSPASAQTVIINASGQLGSTASGGGSVTIAGDTSNMSGSSLSLTGATTAGSTVTFIGNGATAMTFNVNDANNNVMIGSDVGNSSISGINNIALGTHNGRSLSSGSQNLLLGNATGYAMTTDTGNTGVGADVFRFANGSSSNTGIGSYALYNLVNGTYNIAVGGDINATNSAGINYTGSESSNILIANPGVIGDNNIIRIGVTGSGNAEQNTAYIAGIYGVTPSGGTQTVIINASGQLGSTASGGGSVTIAGDTSNMSGSSLSLTANSTAGATVDFVGNGTTAMTLNVTDANNNTIIGLSTAAGGIGSATDNTILGSNQTAYYIGASACTQNVVIGDQTAVQMGRFGADAQSVIIGSNTAYYYGAGSTNNVLVGYQSGNQIGRNSTPSSQNTLVGANAGSSYTGGSGSENNNICLGYNVTGTTGESNHTRIGNTSVTYANVQGIYNTTPGSSTIAPVVIDNNGQLGTSYNNPACPAFSAYLSVDQNNVTGAGAAYIIVCDTVQFDQAANYNNGTGTFTAPITGIYMFVASVAIDNLTIANTTDEFTVVATAGTYVIQFANPGAIMNPGGNVITGGGSAIIPMTSGDTATIQLIVGGGASNSVGIFNGLGFTYFSGYLIC